MVYQNWEKEEVRKALYEEAIVFWLERGVDGFRYVFLSPSPFRSPLVVSNPSFPLSSESIPVTSTPKVP
jgi:hypothetical protein